MVLPELDGWIETLVGLAVFSGMFMRILAWTAERRRSDLLYFVLGACCTGLLQAVLAGASVWQALP